MKNLKSFRIHLAAARPSIYALLLACATIMTGCRGKAAPAAPPKPEVEVATVIQKDVPVYSEWVGTTEGFVNAQIFPKISGYLLKQTYKDGEQVKAGKLLFQIDDRQYKAALDQALGDLAQKKAENKKNQEDFGRYKPLYEQQVVSRQDFDHVDQAARASAAAVQSAQAAVEAAQLNYQWTQVISPIDGIAGIAKTQVGDLVGTTSLLTTVSQLDPIKVTFPISESEYLHFADKIKEHEETGHSQGESYLEMVLADGSTYKYRGHFYVANRQVNIQTGTIIIQGLFPNPDGFLRPGLYAKIRTATDTQHGALLVPRAAVLETQGQYQIAVVGPDNKVSIRQVTLGKTTGELRIVISGVSAGERVITEGLQKVSEGTEVVPNLAPQVDGSPSPSAATPAVPQS